MSNEIEVFRITPKVGKCYMHAEATRTMIDNNGDTVYYTTNTPTYVGRLVRTERSGFGDSSTVINYFDNNGRETPVEYSYEGNTCFIEVNCRSRSRSRSHSRSRGRSSSLGRSTSNARLARSRSRSSSRGRGSNRRSRSRSGRS
uniref:Uncharacterized protein n=1 Tax=viral metagenome TaxID=1070528 RepID=A0A6C0D4C6_9ZZZZ